MEFLSKHQQLRYLVQPLLMRLLPRANKYIPLILSLLGSKKTVLDIGCGDASISVRLQKEGYDVTGLDVMNISFTKKFEPIIYDGQKIPFNNDQFDAALLLMILHHTPEPARIIAEAARVAKRLIIIEDIYTSTLHKYLTYFFDSLLNMEFRGHPHTNKTDAEWQKLFSEMGFQVISISYTRAYLVFKHGVYVLES